MNDVRIPISASDSLAIGWRAEEVLNAHKFDAMRYLGITESSEMVDLFNNYEDAVLPLVQKYGLGTEEYYAHMGREQLGRQVMYHLFGTYPKAFVSFILQFIQTSVSATGIDFGCGSSPVGFDLAKRGHDMYFHDIDGATSYEFLKWRVKEYGIEDRAHFNVWPEENTCVYALFLDSIEHLEDWKTPINKAIECLKPYGSIVTNFMMLSGSENGEHIFMDRGEFSKFMINQGMYPITASIFQKRDI